MIPTFKSTADDDGIKDERRDDFVCDPQDVYLLAIHDDYDMGRSRISIQRLTLVIVYTK
jgi:hypothetical protein